jgi:putative transposase
VARYGVISLEDLKLVNMTKSAKGTKEAPGRGVAQKRGLNRSLQDAALSRLAYWICVKAEEGGRRVWKVDPKDSSRECIACGHTEAANRCRARFSCRKCGHTEHADVNAAQVIAARGQVAETSWRAARRPIARRPAPRNLRRKTGNKTPIGSHFAGRHVADQHGAGSAPYAADSRLRDSGGRP